MAWVTPRTFVTDEFMTAAMFNTNIRDNIGEAWREVELINGGAAAVGITPTYNIQAGATVCTFATRNYPGYPIEILLEVARFAAVDGLVIGVVEGTSPTWLPDEAIMTSGSGERSGLLLWRSSPTAGSHTYKIVAWTGGGGGFNAHADIVQVFQARLMEKALA